MQVLQCSNPACSELKYFLIVGVHDQVPDQNQGLNHLLQPIITYKQFVLPFWQKAIVFIIEQFNNNKNTG